MLARLAIVLGPIDMRGGPAIAVGPTASDIRGLLTNPSATLDERDGPNDGRGALPPTRLLIWDWLIGPRVCLRLILRKTMDDE